MKQIKIKCKLKEKQLQESLVKTQASLIEGGYSNLKDEPVSDLDGDDGEYFITLNVNKVDDKLIPILKELGEPESGTKYFDHDSEEDDSDKQEVVEETVESKVEETTEDPDTIVPLLAIRYMCPKRELHSLVIKEAESVDKLIELAEEGCVITYITSDIDKFNQEYNKGDMYKKVSKLDDLYFSKEELGPTSSLKALYYSKEELGHTSSLKDLYFSKEELGHTSSLKDLYFSEEELMEEDKTELHDETETKVEEKVEDPAPEVKEDPKQGEETVEDPKPEEKVDEVEETKTELHDENEDPEPEPEPEPVDEYKSPVEMLKESQEEFSEESLENFCVNQNNKFRK